MKYKIPSTVRNLCKETKEFFKRFDETEYGRFRSWEHCYLIFRKSKVQGSYKEIKDMLALHLAFYLASWGMYRGSSFLLQRDYTVHLDIIDILYKEEYNDLWGKDLSAGITCNEYLNNNKNIKLLNDIIEELSKYYKKVKKNVVNEEGEETKRLIKKFEFNHTKGSSSKNEDVSDTLLTKILMGTLGCVPAFDRYFMDGIRKFKEQSEKDDEKKDGCKLQISLGKKCRAIKLLSELFGEHDNELPRKKVGDYQYPEMKIIDSCFWQLGYDQSMYDEMKKKRENK